MSRSKPGSRYENLERSQNWRGPMSSHSTPIACRVCNRVFFDNVSLVLHFACHVEDENLIPRYHGRDLASLQSSRHMSSSLPPLSYSLERMIEPQPVVFPRMNDCFRPCPLPVSSAITPNLTPRDSHFRIPVVNSMPPINSPFHARLNPSQPICHSTLSHYRAASSSTHPLMYPQLGSRSFAYSPALVPPLQPMERNGGQGCVTDYKNPQIKQLDKPIQEIIMISDDEEDDNKNAAELDLSLRL